jgi:hypothetical protein
MPAQKTRSSFYESNRKYLEASHKAHQEDEIEIDSFVRIPAGVDNGIAKLTEIGFRQYDDNAKNKAWKGKWYFYARGVAVFPEEYNGRPVAGGTTSVFPEPMFETPDRSRQTFDEHYKFVQKTLDAIGFNEREVEPADLEAALEAWMEEGPHYFKFRTWESKPTAAYPDPRTQHTWAGPAEWDEEAGAPAVVDRTKPSKNGKSEESPDLGELAAAADAGEEEAQNKLRELAYAAGVSEQEVNEAEDWQAVAVLAGGEASGEEESEESEEEEESTEENSEAEDEGDTEEDEEKDFQPVKEDVYGYRPLDPKTKKPAKKPVECEVTGVNSKKRTVNLKNLDNQKIYRDISWDDLISL